MSLFLFERSISNDLPWNESKPIMNLAFWDKKLGVAIKAVFSEENYVPPTAIWACKHFTALNCVTILQAEISSIISRESYCMHKHNFGQTLKLQSDVVTLNIRSRSSKSNQFFSVPIQCIYASLVEIHPVVQKTEVRKGWFYSFYRIVTLIIRSRSPKSNQLFIVSQENNI